MKVKDKDITKYDVVKLNIDSIKSRVNNPFARVEKVLSYLGDEEKENYQIYTKTLRITKRQIALTSKRLFKIPENSRELKFLLKLLFSTAYFTRP